MSGKAKAPRKKNFVMPEPMPVGAILTDVSKQQWKLGGSIGKGGFGEIYAACSANSNAKVDKYPYVIKIEPHDNGPLFVEMHFYMRNLKETDILAYQKSHGLSSFGLPKYVASGRHELSNGNKYRFIVMERFHKDLWSLFVEAGQKFPLHTSYRLTIQMIDVLEYIHSKGYVHADIKSGNILINSGLTQGYLVDFGLASHYNTKDFKPDPRKMHNGTIEFTSRDAHLGVLTRRGDFEILAYNLIHWTGRALPWEKLSDCSAVQKLKETFMADVKKSLIKLYNNDVPGPILDFFQHVAKLNHDTTPDYNKYRTIFMNAVKSLGKSTTGKLDFSNSLLNGSLKPSKTVKTPVTPKVTPLRSRKSPRFVTNTDESNESSDGESPAKKSRKMPLKKVVLSEPKRERVKKDKTKEVETKKKRNFLEYSYWDDENVEIVIKKTNKNTGAVETRKVRRSSSDSEKEEAPKPQRVGRSRQPVKSHDVSVSSEEEHITPVKKRPRAKAIKSKESTEKPTRSKWMDCPTIKSGKGYVKK